MPEIAANLLTATPVLDLRVTPPLAATAAHTATLPVISTPTGIAQTIPLTPSIPADSHTATPVEGTSTPVEALTVTATLSVTATPIRISPFGDPPVFPVRDLPVDYGGTGPFTLGIQSGGLTLYFLPPEPIAFRNVRSLTFVLTPAGNDDPPNVYLLFFRYTSPETIDGSPGSPLDWGANRLAPPPTFINQDGGILVRLINQGYEPLQIGDLGLQLVLELLDGRVVRYGVNE
jgi:hypothetical protein